MTEIKLSWDDAPEGADVMVRSEITGAQFFALKKEDGELRIFFNNDFSIDARIKYWKILALRSDAGIELPPKNPIYQSQNGSDHIDDFEENNSPDEFRAAMNFNIQKYSKRYGKKDDHLKEAKKIADYAQRLIAYEESLLAD